MELTDIKQTKIRYKLMAEKRLNIVQRHKQSPVRYD